MSRASISFDTIRADSIEVNRLSVRDVSLRYPIQIIHPSEDTEVITLSSTNAGHIIDANIPTNEYIISLDEDIRVGDRWIIYVNSNNGISLVNNTGKPFTVGGFVYLNTYVYASTTYPNEFIRLEPATKAKYDVTITEITPSSIRASYDVIYTNIVI